MFFHTNGPLGPLFDFHFAGYQSPIGEIPNLPSHQELEQGLKQGLTTSHKNITLVLCDLCLTQHFGFFHTDGEGTSPSPG